MVWPSIINYNTFEGVIKNHNDVAKINKALFCPVGEVWKSNLKNDDTLIYYSTDNFHPSLLGSQVAAKFIVESLLN